MKIKLVKKMAAKNENENVIIDIDPASEYEKGDLDESNRNSL